MTGGVTGGVRTLRRGLESAAALALAAGLIVAAAPAHATAGVTAGATTGAADDTRPATVSRDTQRIPVDDPLQVSLDSVAPAVLVPDRGPVVLRGTVTNISDDTWTDLNVYPFLAPTPITSAAELATAAATDPDDVPGGRIVESDRPELADTIDRLDPGEQAGYTVRIPREILQRDLGGVRGVYWFGVQALGSDSTGRDTLADGRAYTFLPLVPRRGAGNATRVAVVVPLRQPVAYDREGRLRGRSGWARALATDGRLSHLLGLGEAAAPGRLTWLVDPAVLDAVRRLSLGDPGRTLTTAGATDPADPDADPDADPSASPGDGGEPDAATDEPVPVDPALRSAAQDWLDRMLPVLRRDSVLALPYGDLDVAAASLRDPSMLRRATRLSATVLDDLEVTARPAVAPASGWLKPTSVAAVDPGTTILAADTVAAAGLPAGRVRPAQIEVGSRTVDLYDAAASSGGPGPDDPTGPVALRQRLLSEAALRARRSDPPGLVVSLPATWDPGPGAARLLAGLDRPWLALVPQPAMGVVDPPEVGLNDLVYPEQEVATELPPVSFIAAEDLRRAGDTLDGLLVGPTTVGRQVLSQALVGLAYDDRDRPRVAAARARSATERVREDLALVTIDTPDFVTLSSTAGNRFRVDLANALPAAVRVLVDPVVDAGLSIATPGVITIEAGATSSPLLVARSTRLGFHQVDLQLTNPDGVRLGASAELPVRSSRTGRVIWVIIAGGAALLFGAIAMRLVRRFRRHRAARRRHPAGRG